MLDQHNRAARTYRLRAGVDGVNGHNNLLEGAGLGDAELRSRRGKEPKGHDENDEAVRNVHLHFCGCPLANDKSQQSAKEIYIPGSS